MTALTVAPTRPRLLDLFTGGGGCAVGYHRAGFDVTCVDIKAQRNHPGTGLFPQDGFRFIQADALEYLRECGHCFDAIHASPPCQAHTQLKTIGIARNGGYPVHPDLVGPTRDLLIESGKPFVIENVPGAPLVDPVMLCGTMFPPLRVYRHRLFEVNWKLVTPVHLPHKDTTPPVGQGASPKGFISVCGNGGVKGMTERQILRYWQMAMGIDWMCREELSQAIPPPYTEFIGKRLLSVLTA